MRVHSVNAFKQLPDRLQKVLSAPGLSPFFNADFLGLLETTGCINARHGWQPRHLWIEEQGEPVFYMPIYAKTHSWGEFVFDQRWAQFYQEHGLHYYPKWVTCIPFTPSVGPRWWVAHAGDETSLLTLAIGHVTSEIQSGIASSWHLLFAEDLPLSARSSDLLSRQDTQFHWFNHDYKNFDDFLARLKSRKRKKIRHERQRVAAQGVTLQVVEGPDLAPQDWQTFYHCYRSTYNVRGQAPYLNAKFFTAIGTARAHQIMMVQARREGNLVGAALCFHDGTTLYGRHWGALESIDCLHFEACFYQGIEYCIRKGLKRFDPGTQGEHKLLRGFEPVQTTSWHYIAQPAFRRAIAQYLEWEKQQSQRYFEAAGTWLPYKVDPSETDQE